MQWSVWAALAAVVVAAALGGAGAASSRSSVVNQGYEDVVVGLSPLLDESQAEEIIAALKEALVDTSQALFKATGNKLYFRKVKVLVPSTWTNVTVDQAASSESYENSDLRVDLKNPVYGDQVYTQQPGGCGEPGQYIHATPAYLTHPDAEKTWGPRGKVLAQAWARLRWGVFDEVGYPGDERYPLFYHTWNELQDLVVRPNHCADEDLSGRYVDLYTQDQCSYENDGLPDDNCRFVPNDQQIATTSLMSFTTLSSIERFCTGEDNTDGNHNAEAPNRHNLLCEGRSVGAVMADHSDFWNATSLPVDHPVTPEVVVVQEVAANFALVLDYSGSMSGTKIDNLANTAKRWLLHDVADGSFVTIIKFTTEATTLIELTEVSNTTRRDLADAITNSAGGGTSIGCGLQEALLQLGNQNNKVILLISDGEETDEPTIADVIDEVVESGARVISIAYGNGAADKMEELAQQTGGKAYIVPEDDDGSSMDDAFQGSLTYQPGQSITNTNIQIYEDDVSLNGAEVTGNFTVDSTVGRNLEFRLDMSSAGQSGAPYLTSPAGVDYTDAEFTDNLNLWIIKVDLAESGTWSWTLPTSPSNATAMVTVTAQARDPEVLPIYTESWMNTGVDYVNASSQRVVVFARVTQGGSPVVGARVRAYITTPDTTAAAVEMDLLDNGKNADVQAGDGTYSRYFTQYAGTGRYAVKAQVWDDGSSYINNGFIASRRHRRSLSVPAALPRLVASSQLDVPEYCCGSVVPFDPSRATPTGAFTRNAAAGSFNVIEVPVGGDAFPPARVLDLRANINNSPSLTLTWTAPGDDLDAGIVSGYEIWMADNSTALTGNLNDNSTIPLLDLDTSSNMTELLKEAGEEISLELILEEPLEEDVLYFVALQAVDDVGNRSPLSSLARFTAPTPTSPPPQDDGLEGWAIALIVIGCVAGVVLIAGVSYLIYKKNTMTSKRGLYLLNSEEHLLGSKLPSSGQVLSVFLHHHLYLGKQKNESALEVVKELLAFWARARIPTQRPDKIQNKILALYDRWQRLKKSKGRRSTKQEENEQRFSIEMKNLFDVAHADAICMIKIQEDRDFLLAQREPGRRGNMGSVDKSLAKKEVRSLKRKEAHMKRREKEKEQDETSSCRVELASSSSASTSSSDSEENTQEEILGAVGGVRPPKPGWEKTMVVSKKPETMV